MKNRSFFLLKCLLLIFLYGNPIFCQENNNDSLSITISQISKLGTQQSISSLGSHKQIDQQSKKYTIDIFLGIGYMPFETNFGVGYFFSRGLEGYTKIAVLLTPNDFLFYNLSFGVKFIEMHKSGIVYSLEAGILLDGIEKDYNGIILKGGIGYMFWIQSGLHIGSNFNVGLLSPNDDEKVLIRSLEFVIGISL